MTNWPIGAPTVLSFGWLSRQGKTQCSTATNHFSPHGKSFPILTSVDVSFLLDMFHYWIVIYYYTIWIYKSRGQLIPVAHEDPVGQSLEDFIAATEPDLGEGLLGAPKGEGHGGHRRVACRKEADLLSISRFFTDYILFILISYLPLLCFYWLYLISCLYFTFLTSFLEANWLRVGFRMFLLCK